MRIIAGQRRGHNLEGPPDRSVRPTSDKVREALFAILRERIEGLPVFDLFAGTGALGLEALSRGAATTTFVELNRRMVGVIRRNIRRLRFERETVVETADVFRWVEKKLPHLERPALVLIDPPYRLYEEESARIQHMFQALLARLPAGSIIVAETSKYMAPEILPDRPNWDIRRYGDTELAIYEQACHSALPAAISGPAAERTAAEAPPSTQEP